MARPSIEGVHVNLRIRRELRDQILARAERHHTSLNNMIRLMLEDAFAQQNTRTLADITSDMAVQYARLSSRLSLMEREGALIEALAFGDPQATKTQARALLEIYKSAQRLEQRFLAERALVVTESAS
jgi:hypothetical protein